MTRKNRLGYAIGKAAEKRVITVNPDPSALEEPRKALIASAATSHTFSQVGIQLKKVFLFPSLSFDLILPKLVVFIQDKNIIFWTLNEQIKLNMHRKQGSVKYNFIYYKISRLLLNCMV
jgi:hypothetical protein